MADVKGMGASDPLDGVEMPGLPNGQFAAQK
jgi:hypothetical protein